MYLCFVFYIDYISILFDGTFYDVQYCFLFHSTCFFFLSFHPYSNSTIILFILICCHASKLTFLLQPVFWSSIKLKMMNIMAKFELYMILTNSRTKVLDYHIPRESKTMLMILSILSNFLSDHIITAHDLQHHLRSFTHFFFFLTETVWLP